jgi:WD40 repeat protein
MLGLERETKLAAPAITVFERWRASVDDYVISMAWSLDERYIAVASIRGPVYIFEVETGRLSRSLVGHQMGATVVTWRPKSKDLASAGQDGKIRIWSSESGEILHELGGGSSWVEHLAWSPDGDVLASAAGRKLRLWNASGNLIREYPEHPNTIAAIAWRPKTTELASACYGQIQLWNPQEEQPIRTLSWKGSMLTLAWSPDGRYLCHGNQDSTVHFWILKGSKPRDLQMWGYPTKIRELDWDRHSRYLATGGGSQVTIWDCSGKGPANTKPIVHKYHKQLLTQLTYQHGGPLLASGCAGGQIAVWGPGRAKGPTFTAALGSAVTQLAWSPTDTLLAAACEDGTLAVLPMQEAQMVFKDQSKAGMVLRL